ncbi:hypothetical protein GQ44DRAFT_706763 [Phaeosphaeriaceae sp. PMI808]|nr:hypothetical protein GQ44DRAFT_706763 [Phaeosphaeriaceae sp. PMI808]
MHPLHPAGRCGSGPEKSLPCRKRNIVERKRSKFQSDDPDTNPCHAMISSDIVVSDLSTLRVDIMVK